MSHPWSMVWCGPSISSLHRWFTIAEDLFITKKRWLSSLNKLFPASHLKEPGPSWPWNWSFAHRLKVTRCGLYALRNSDFWQIAWKRSALRNSRLTWCLERFSRNITSRGADDAGGYYPIVIPPIFYRYCLSLYHLVINHGLRENSPLGQSFSQLYTSNSRRFHGTS